MYTNFYLSVSLNVLYSTISRIKP